MDKAAVLAYGFLCVANKTMCQPICALTWHRSHKPSAHVLACFGGARPKHTFALARTWVMPTVFVHCHSGVLCTYGVNVADAVEERQILDANIWNNNDDANCKMRFTPLVKETNKALTN